MILTNYQIALIAGGFTIIGGLLGAWINHRLAQSRDKELRKKDRFDAAALKFRGIIAKELSEFKSRGGIFYDDRVAHLSTIHAACIEFLPTLSQSNQERFANLWQEYNKYEKLRTITLLEMPDEKTEYYLTQFLSFTE